MTFYFMGVSNENGMCMKRPKLWETVTTPTCITLYRVAVVRTIAPGCNHYNTRLSSQGRKQHSAGRGGGPGRGGEGICTCILTSVIWHLEAAIGCDDTELTIQDTGKDAVFLCLRP